MVTHLPICLLWTLLLQPRLQEGDLLICQAPSESQTQSLFCQELMPLLLSQRRAISLVTHQEYQPTPRSTTIQRLHRLLAVSYRRTGKGVSTKGVQSGNESLLRRMLCYGRQVSLTPVSYIRLFTHACAHVHSYIFLESHYIS